MKYLLIILLFASCSKQQQEVKRFGGALPDMPNNTSVLVSKGFIQAKGRPSTTVSFLSPVNGSAVSGVVNISLSTKGKVVSSYILINGVRVASGLTYSWNTTGQPSGLYTLTGAVYDGVNTISTSITVTINTVVVEPPPVSTEVSLTTPSVGNQGNEGSCVAFAVGYAARSIDWYYKTGTMKVFSPEHLYNQIKFSDDCSVGAAMQPAFEFVMANGILPYSSMPYSSGSCSLQPNAEQVIEAASYKIAGFSKIYTADRAMIKSMINQKKAVVISVTVDNAFINATAGFIWRVAEGYTLAHCVAIVGYDDSKNAYKIMNSWSANWGDNGFGWIDYDLFTTRTGTYCYAIN